MFNELSFGGEQIIAEPGTNPDSIFGIAENVNYIIKALLKFQVSLPELLRFGIECGHTSPHPHPNQSVFIFRDSSYPVGWQAVGVFGVVEEIAKGKAIILAESIVCGYPKEPFAVFE